MITNVVNGKRVRQYEADDFTAIISRYIDGLERQAADEDPWTLADMEMLQAKLEDAKVRTVARLRKAGYTWEAIGFNLKISAITAHKRYADKIKNLEV